jgi:hypothetical protein
MAELKDLPSISIRVTGDHFRKKVRQALDAWLRLYPYEARKFVRDMKKKKGTRARSNGMDEEGDLGMRGSFPPTVVDMLRATKFASQLLYGCECGTGDRAWDTRPELQEIFFAEMTCAEMSNLRGQPSGAHRNHNEH